MILYLSIIFLILILSYFYDFRGMTHYKSFWYSLLCLIFVFLAGFRYRIGTDTISYERWFNSSELFLLPELSVKNLFRSGGFEPLFILLSSFFKTIFGDFYYLQFFITLILNLSVFSFIRKYAASIFLPIGLYFVLQFYNLNCEVLRESIAISIFLFSIRYLAERRWALYYLCVFIAFFFHYSAVFLFLLPFLKFLKINKYHLIIIALLFFLSSIVNQLFHNYLYLLLLNDRMSNKLNAYASTDLTEILNFNINGYIIFLFNNLLLPIIAYYSVKKWDKNKNSILRKKYVFEYLLALELIVVACKLAFPLLYRYEDYLFIFSVLFISDFIIEYARRNKRKRSSLSLVFSLMFLIPLFYNLVRTNLSNMERSNVPAYVRFVPYSSIFSEEKDAKRESLFRYFNK